MHTLRLLGIFVLLLILMLATAPLHAQSPEVRQTSNTFENGKTYTSLASTFMFEYPADWSLIDNGRGLIYVSNQDAATIAQQTQGQNWFVPAPGDLYFAIYEPLGASQLAGSFPDMPAMEMAEMLGFENLEETTLGNTPAVTGSLSFDGSRVRVYVVDVEGMLAVMIAAFPETEPESSHSIAELIVASFRYDGLATLDQAVLSDLTAQLDGKIAFVSGRNGQQFDLFTMNPDGSEVTEVFTSPENESCPSWSPDGTQIVYAVNDGSTIQISSANIDGSNRQQITNASDGLNGSPDWSPDGSQIVYVNSASQSETSLMLMDSNGANNTRLTGSDFGYINNPKWSVDGTQIAFVAGQTVDGEKNLYLINRDGSNLREIASAVADNSTIGWSPDGTHLAFHRTDGENLQVFVIDADGSNEQQITDAPFEVRSPVWSPDGTHLLVMATPTGFTHLYLMDLEGSLIGRVTQSLYDGCANWWYPAVVTQTNEGMIVAFVSNRDGNEEIYLLNVASGEETNLTQDAATDTTPRWSPDGSQIAFVSDRAGEIGIFVMAADGSDVRALMPGIAPVWSPDGSKIAYECSDALACVVNVDGTDPLVLNDVSGTYVGLVGSDLQWSPDGTKILVETPLSVFPVITLDGEVVAANQTNAPIYNARWLDDSTLLVGTGSGIYTVPLNSMASSGAWQVNLETLGTDQMVINSQSIFALSPDAATLVFAGRTPEVVWYPVQGSTSESLITTEMAASTIDWSSDSQSLAFAGSDGDTQELFLIAADGSEQQQLTDNTADDYDPDIRPEAITTDAAASQTVPDCTITAPSNVNKRSGPGTEFARAGRLSGGESLAADGQNVGGDGFVWYRLVDASWVRSDVITASGNCEALPTVSP